MDLAAFAGRDFQTFPIAGRDYRVYELKMRDWAELQAWLKERSPSPLTVLQPDALAALDADTRRQVVRLAYEEARTWPPALGTKPWFMALVSTGADGNVQLLQTLLRAGHPDLTTAEVAELMEALDAPTVLRMFTFAMWGPPDPKAAAAAPATPAARPNRRTRRTAAARK